MRSILTAYRRTSSSFERFDRLSAMFASRSVATSSCRDCEVRMDSIEPPVACGIFARNSAAQSLCAQCTDRCADGGYSRDGEFLFA